MSFVINTNIAAITANSHTNRALNGLGKSLENLSNGKRIQGSADDAGGLSVALKLNSRNIRTEALSQNAQNALSYLQVQDGYLKTIGKILNRFGELRTMAHDVTKNAADVENYNKEFMELQMQLGSIATEEFNGSSLFTPLTMWPPADWNPDVSDNPRINREKGALTDNHSQWPNRRQVSFDKYSRSLSLQPDGGTNIGNVSLSVVNSNYILALNMPALMAKHGPESVTFLARGEFVINNILAISIGQITNAIGKLAETRAENGAEQNAVRNVYDQLQSSLVNLENAQGRIMDADIASETTRLTKHKIMRDAGVSMHLHANRLTNLGLTLMGLE